MLGAESMGTPGAQHRGWTVLCAPGPVRDLSGPLLPVGKQSDVTTFPSPPLTAVIIGAVSMAVSDSIFRSFHLTKISMAHSREVSGNFWNNFTEVSLSEWGRRAGDCHVHPRVSPLRSGVCMHPS